MNWKEVGGWLKDHAGPGAALVGSLLTGNIPGAVAAGVALVTSATGEAAPDMVLASLQANPVAMLKLRELALADEASIREHIRAMAEIEAKDAQAEHHETQETVRNGDNAEDVVVRRTRPFQSWASLVGAFLYVGFMVGDGKEPSLEILMALLALPWAYAGLRQFGKWSADKTSVAVLTAKKRQEGA